MFAAVFAVGGALVIAFGVLAQKIDPSQRFLAMALLLIFALYSAGAAAIVGAIVGLLFVLLPSRARDPWIASAISVGMVASGALLSRTFLFQPISTSWLVALLCASALVGAVSAWCVRPRGANS